MKYKLLMDPHGKVRWSYESIVIELDFRFYIDDIQV